MSFIEEHNLELARYIWSILKTQISVLLSWGINLETVGPVTNGLEFHVEGFIHKGKVKVELNEGRDLFEITLVDDLGVIVKRIEDIYLDELVNIIDRNVERTNDYNTRLREYLKKEVV